MEEEEEDSCTFFGCTDEEKSYTFLAVGSFVVAGLGVYFLNKKKKGLGTKVAIGLIGLGLLKKYVINKEEKGY